MYHQFYLLSLVTQTNPGTAWERTTQNCAWWARRELCAGRAELCHHGEEFETISEYTWKLLRGLKPGLELSSSLDILKVILIAGLNEQRGFQKWNQRSQLVAAITVWVTESIMAWSRVSSVNRCRHTCDVIYILGGRTGRTRRWSMGDNKEI